MTVVLLTAAAVDDLAGLIRSRNLPASTGARLRRSLEPLGEFPELGATIGGQLGEGPFGTRRFVLGPWRWMIVVYVYDRASDRVVVLAIIDGRTSGSPLANR